jgi:hypothetical protein
MFFSERVEGLFKWHKEDYKTYLAPYFPLIQSSGMGKTKILFEYRSRQNVKDSTCRVLLILCKTRGDVKTTDQRTYDHVLEVSDQSDIAARDHILENLELWTNKARQQFAAQEIVLLFDEARSLLLIDEGFPFRCIRLWLRRQQHTEKKPVVAVFTGTDSALANFYREPPMSKHSRNQPIPVYDSGNKLYNPFFDISTIGCLRGVSGLSIPRHDYHRAVPYGRPLFTLMLRDNKLDATTEHSILMRMLLNQGGSTWENNEASLFSILSTRVQMGQTSASVASSLVSLGYANLTRFSGSKNNGHEVADTCHFTDPVCARLAMCLMDGGWQSNEVKGQLPNFWTGKAFDLFASGMCQPNKGDLGEIAVALYLLFCGDIIRKKMNDDKKVNDGEKVNDNYCTFGISFSSWLAVMNDPPRDHENESKDADIDGPRSKRARQSTDSEVDSEADIGKVSFIQFRRLHLRLPLASLLTQEFLKDLYLSGTARCLYSACPVFDFVASIQQNDEKTYQALLINVKSYRTFRASDIKSEFVKMAYINAMELAIVMSSLTPKQRRVPPKLLVLCSCWS